MILKPWPSSPIRFSHRYPALVEMQRRGVRGPPAHLLQFRARQARRIALDQQQADAARALAAGAHGNGQIIGPHARRDEGLFAADDIMVAVALRPGAEIGDVGAAARLGDRERGNLLPRQHLRQHPCLDLGPGGAGDRRRADGVAHQARTDPAGAGARQFLRSHDLHELIGRDAAIFFRKTQAQQPDLGGLGIELARKLAGFVPFMGIGLDLARHEAAHHVAKRFMFRRIERALHPCPLQHAFLPRDYDAPIWPAQTCVERLALLCRQRTNLSAASRRMPRPATERKTGSPGMP